MSDHIKVSVNRMRSDSDELQELIERLPQAIENLGNTMDALALCWEGPAFVSFQKQVSSDIDNMEKLYRFLSNYISHIETGSQKYLEAEQNVYKKKKNT